MNDEARVRVRFMGRCSLPCEVNDEALPSVEAVGLQASN